MATVTRDKTPSSEATSAPPKAKKKSRAGRTMFLFATLVALVALAPTIASRTPLGGKCLSAAARLAGVNGSVTAGQLSLGWLSPISVSQVEVVDPDGNTLVSLASVDSDKTLLDLLLHRSDLGRIQLDGAKADVTFTDTGSNLEEVLGTLLSTKANSAPVACELEMADAQATIHDAASKRDWTVDKLTLHLVTPAGEQPLSVALAAVVRGEGTEGHLTVNYPPTGNGPGESPAKGAGPRGPSTNEVVLQAESLPLALVQPLARRVVPGCQLDGRLEAQLGWRCDANDGLIVDGTTTVNGWRLEAPGCAPWTEEQLGVTLSAAGTLDGATLARIETAQANAATSAGRIDLKLAEAVEAPSSESTWPVTVGIEGDLATWLARFVPALSANGGWRVAGHCQATGDMQVSRVETKGGLVLTVDDLVLTPPGGQPGTPEQARLTVNGVYQSAAGSVQLDKFELESAVVRVDANGQLDELGGDAKVQLEGQVDYDLQQVEAWLRPQLGDSLQLTGREAKSFSLSAPLPSPGEDPLAWLARSTAKCELGWQSAGFHGFGVGQGQMEAQLADGLIRVSPVDLPVSQGQVHLAPQLRLSPTPPMLTQDPGRIVDSVVLTPEMCKAGMRYAVPILAGVTQAQGRFSVDLADCQLPPANAGAGSAAGKITIHSVELGPGLLVREFGPVLETLHQVFRADAPDPLAGVSIARECPVDFKLVNGRVYHRGLVFAFPNVTVSTFGSVGLDETLAIMAELALPQQWTANHPLGAALASKPLRIPIGGTLQQPRIDSREIERLAGQGVREAAEGVIHHELGRELQNGLDHLFGPMK